VQPEDFYMFPWTDELNPRVAMQSAVSKL
jgi:hypothetical protein